MANKKKNSSKNRRKRPPQPQQKAKSSGNAGGTNAPKAAAEGAGEAGKAAPKAGAKAKSAAAKGGGGTARQAAASRSRNQVGRRGSRQQMSATTSWLVLGAGIVVIVGVAVFLAVRSQADTGTGEVAADASAWDLPALDSEGDTDGDGRITLAEFDGTPTVVNFFASWCTECNRELPAFRTLADTFRDEIDFVFVNSNETGNWRPMASEHEILEFPLVRDIGPSGNRLYRALDGTTGMPITAFYDADGNHVFTNPGGMTIETVTATLERFDLLPT